jgi:uncharacterized membrane protein YdjX (TVP38/TMEM64 family)
VDSAQQQSPRLRPWFGITVLIVSVLAAGFWTWRWLSSIGGPTALSDRFGALAPLVSIPAHVVLAATPFPSELIGVANGSIYGLWAGTLYGWIAWWSAGMLVYVLARRGAHGVDEAALGRRVPSWLKRFPVEHPVFLIVGRQVPFGFHAINVMAAIGGVSPRRQMLLSAISNLIYAFLAAATGTGLVSIGGPGR